MERVTKNRIIFGIKITITAIILYLLFRSLDLQKVFQLTKGLRVSVFLILLVTSALKFYTQYLNWEKCLRINQGFLPAGKDVLKTLFIGSALRFLLPGGHATYGKVYFLNHAKKGTLISVGLEKFMLTWTVLFYGSWAALFYFTEYSIVLRITVTAFISIIPLLAYWLRFFFKKQATYFDRCFQTIPMITLTQGIYIYLTALQYFLIINQYQCLLFRKAIISVPLILTANTIPITYSGLGLRETFSMHILADFNIGAEVAVTASLLIFFINAVIPALIGGYLIIVTKRTTPQRD